VDPVLAKSELPPKNPPENNVEDLAGTCSTLFSGGLFWDQFLLDLRVFFGTHFRYKLMYYYFYHGSDLREIIQILSKIPNLSYIQNNPPENNVEPVPAKSELHLRIDF
jgi:hypothetical protein